MPKLDARNLTEAQFPFRDRPMNVFDFRSWWSLILGIAVLAILTSLARPLTTWFQGRLAGVPGIGAHVGLETTQEAAAPQVRMLQ